MPRSPALRPRKSPAQSRARATVEAILDATAAVLREGGAERLTTNAIAARAGINVASLYGYFPNKFAVLAALWDRMQARQRGLLDELARSPDVALADAVDTAIDAIFDFVLREPGFTELADAIRLLPELRELSQQAHQDAARALGELLGERARGSAPVTEETKRRTEAMAGVIVEATSSVLAHARRSPARRRRAIVAELKAMLSAYLEGPLARGSTRSRTHSLEGTHARGLG